MNLKLLPQAQLVERSSAVDNELALINKRLISAPPDAATLRTKREALIAEKATLVAEFQRRREDRGYLLVLEFEGEKAYHAIRGDTNEWAANMLQEVGIEAPLIVFSVPLTSEQLDRLPPEIFECPF